MATRSLPARPDLDQLKRQARELQHAHRAGDPRAGARIAAHHPRWRGCEPSEVLAETIQLAAAQLVIAREYGFPNWARLKHVVTRGLELLGSTEHPRFAEALAALDAGDLDRLRALLVADPALAVARTNLDPRHGYFAGATLLHHVAGNPGRENPLPANVIEVARLLLEHGADVHAETLGQNGGTTMGLLVTSHQASRRGVTEPLMDLLLAHGAVLDLRTPGVLDAALTNHAPRAAEHMIGLGAAPDLFAAAALGRMDLLRGMFTHEGRLCTLPRRPNRTFSERDAIGLAFLYAYVNRREEAMEFLLARDGNWDMTGVNNGTALHRAAWEGNLPMIARLVALGADTTNRDNPFDSTPLNWAQHNRQVNTMAWFRDHTPVDLHDAVSFDYPEHIAARLAEDPEAVHRRIDHWDLPMSTALHWAASPSYNDVEEEYTRPPERLQAVMEQLLDAGGDPNVIAGNGMTVLDVALACEATVLVPLIGAHGGRRAEDLAAR